METLIIKLPPFEVTNSTKLLTHLRFAEFTIKQLKQGYDHLIKYLDDLAQDSDPNITENEIVFSLIRPQFENLMIYHTVTADYDYCKQSNQYIKITEVTLAFEIYKPVFEELYYKQFREQPNYEKLKFIRIQ